MTYIRKIRAFVFKQPDKSTSVAPTDIAD